MKSTPGSQGSAETGGHGFILRNQCTYVVWQEVALIGAGVVSIAAGVLLFATLPGSLLFLMGVGILLIAAGAAMSGGMAILEFVGPIGTVVMLAGLYIAHLAGSFPF